MHARGLVVLMLLTSACAVQREVEVPTQAVLPTAAPSETPTVVPTVTPTSNPSPTLESRIPIPTAIPTTTPVTSMMVLIGNINVTNAPGIAVRRLPSLLSEIIGVFPGGTFATAQRRSDDNQWYEVVNEQGIRGWVEARDVFAVQDLALLPAVESLATQVVAAPTLTPTVTITPSLTITATVITSPTAVTLGDIAGMERRLLQTPILMNMTNEHVRWIFLRGQDFGIRANVFTTVGDSNTTNGDFLKPIGMGTDEYCTWGSYGYLQETVDYFSVPPSEDAANSFTHKSVAALRGFTSASVLDPFWATAAACYTNESPLMCEYRSIRPSVVIIMLGGIDINELNTAEYFTNMSIVVQTAIQQGVIPVLTTFPVLPERDVYEKSLEFNMMLLDIAESQHIPLINLWAAAQTLPGYGIGPDGTHLKAQIGSFCAFDGAQQQFGGTLRNLLTLQALDTLRQNILSQ